MAVDYYLKDFNRGKTLYLDKKMKIISILLPNCF